MRTKLLTLTAIFTAIAVRAMALGPHEVLVLVNSSSSNSTAAAETFVRLRDVPEQNVIRLKLPTHKGEMTSTAFSKFIWTPAQGIARVRGIDDHILAWVYSTDFPYRIGTDGTAVSLQGITFVRNGLPDKIQINQAKYISPLFTGPSSPSQKSHEPQSLDQYAQWLDKKMPLPSMVLGCIGENGNTMEEIFECLKNGSISDGTAPTGTVYFSVNSDVRSRCRDWQFSGATLELKKLGVNAVTMKSFPSGKSDVIGLMQGSAGANPDKNRKYLPGCMAEHLTSAAAIFDSKDQTKLTAWIRAGATASAGTVIEPFSYWTKFPHAIFFYHYASGCTMIESFFQSIRSPMQILLVGEPLACPWKKKGKLVITGLEDDVLTKPTTVKASVKCPPGDRYSRFMFLVDGIKVQFGTDAEFTIMPKNLSEEPHRLRVVAYSSNLVRNQLFATKEFLVQK